MKMMSMKMMMVTSTIIPMLKNPISMGTMLIMQTMISSILINKISTSSWMMMITFLMMVGGLLILFTYMSSIASNEKFKFKMNMSMIMMMLMILTDEMMMETQIEEKMEMIKNIGMEKTSLMKLYNKKSMMMTIMLAMYLILTMISITKMVKHFKGPLRSKKYE